MGEGEKLATKAGKGINPLRSGGLPATPGVCCLGITD